MIGYADLASNTPATFGDAFRIGSTSKPVTAMAVGILMEEGRLDLDASLRSLDPTLPSRFGDVTVGHAMSHRGGIRDYGVCLCFPIWEAVSRKSFGSVRDAVGVIEDDALLFPPGEGFSYMSLGYNLAGLAVVQASGSPFPATLRRLVLDPLGMTGTLAEDARGSPHPSVSFYEVADGRYKTAYPVDNSIKWPSGGLRSTPTDMTRLGQAMMRDELFSAEVRERLLTVPAGGESEDYAHGWRVGWWDAPVGATPFAWHHNGTAAGSRSVFFVLPQAGLAVSLMSNKGGSDASDLAAIANEVAGPFLSAGRSLPSR